LLKKRRGTGRAGSEEEEEPKEKREQNESKSKRRATSLFSALNLAMMLNASDSFIAERYVEKTWEVWEIHAIKYHKYR
jgi:hypothetical protein